MLRLFARLFANQSRLPVFKLDPQDFFSILSGVMVEEVAVSKSVPSRARN